MRAVRIMTATIASVALVVAVFALVHVGDGSAGLVVSPERPVQSAPLAGESTVVVDTPIVVTIARTHGTTVFVPGLP